MPSIAFASCSCHPVPRALPPLPPPTPFTHRNKAPLLHLPAHLWKRGSIAADGLRPPRTKNDAAPGDWSDDGMRVFDVALESAKKMLERVPEPVKRFPWGNVGVTYVSILFELIFSVVKFLAAPLLAVSSLSEMSYCAHEKKMVVIPVPFIAGIAFARILGQTFVDLSSDRKDAKFPWDVVLMAVFFLLLKLPGPYYPYVGRLIVPHFANGGLWSTLWIGFNWFRKVPEYNRGDSPEVREEVPAFLK